MCIRDSADILVDEGYVEKYDLVDNGNFKDIRITLKYGKDKNDKIIAGLKRISKPGLRVYASREEPVSYTHLTRMSVQSPLVVLVV